MARILVVEDEEALRVLAESILEEMGHQTTTAATIDEAWTLLESDQKFDLLFTDIGLGENLQAGIELAVRAREQRPELPVLYTTGQGVTDGMKALFVDGFHFISKPYTVDILSAALGNALPKD
jgi:DNA-binding NtrC family response regulator